MNIILKKIVEAEGSCTMWASPSVCKQCPLSKLKQKADGHYLSCVEALNIDNLTEEEADAKYKEVASRLILDEAVDDMLGEPSGSK